MYPQPEGYNMLTGIYPEVWSQKSPAGESYEFKVNCGAFYEELETCFLWDLDLVKVTAPDGTEYELEKDFNINEYSGEVTRRWVLYGPEEAQLPQGGTYTFQYLRGGETIFSQRIEYTPSSISYPTNVEWERKGDDIYVSWAPPEGAKSNMWYKVIIKNEVGTPEIFVSDKFKWSASDATLKAVPFVDGGKYQLNVALFYPHGYAYSKYTIFEW